MGALTDSRKRGFFDHSFLPVSSPSLPPKHRPDLSAETPVAKKLRTLSPASRLELGGAAENLKQEVSGRLEPPQFPLPAPLRKQVQGPQRHIKVFGLGNHEQKPLIESVNAKTSSWEMGNFLSRGVRQTPLQSIWSSGKKKDTILEDGSGRGLTLDAYKRQVDDLEERKSGELAPELVASPRTPITFALDLTTSTDVAEEIRGAHVSDKKGHDEKELKVEMTPKSEDKWTKRTPLYKDLLEQTSRKYDSKLSSLDFEVKLTEKKISHFHLISEKKPKKDILEPFAPLTENEENDVDLALQDPDRPSHWREIVVMHEASNIEITRENMQCLRHGAWLNDEVINLYFELLKEREKREPKKFLKCHFFNTFFYKKLASGRDGYDFKAVRRWTTQRKIGYGLIECDKIFVPIHKEIHWCLAVINVKEKKFQYLDSLGGMDNKVPKVLARYLNDEANEKNQVNIDVNSWKNEFVDGLPLQKNGWDCGMFMLKYVDFYSRGLSLSFNQDDMNYFRRRTVKELLRLKAD